MPGLKLQLSKTASQDKWKEFTYDRNASLEDFAPKLADQKRESQI